MAREVADSVIKLYRLVEKVVQLYKESEALNRTTLRFIEHHFPESCYFLRKLANFDPAVFDIGDCPLTKPTIH